MTIEIFLLLKKEDQQCTNIEELQNYIASDSKLKISDQKIEFTDKEQTKHAYKLLIETGDIENSNERYFKVNLDSESNSLETTEGLIRRLKGTLSKIQNDSINISILQNDVLKQNAIEAYPIIFDLENLMRKVISKFMLLNIGSKWINSSINSEIEKYILKRKIDLDFGADDIHGTDFIHLSGILFNKYREKNLTDLDKELDKDKSKWPDINLELYKSKSNWERHFSYLIDSDPDKLKSDWEDLYKIRNKVAHCRGLTSYELKKLKTKSTEIIQVLNKANVKVEEFKLSNAESVRLGTQVEDLISKWYSLDDEKNPFKSDFRGFDPEWLQDNTAEWTAHLIAKQLAKK